MNRRDRRALTMGTVVIALAWIASRGIPGALRSIDRLEASAEQRVALLERAHARLALLPRLTDSIALLEGVADSLPDMVLAAGDASTAQVALMHHVRSLLERCPVAVRGFEPAPTEAKSGPLVLASIVVSIETDFRGLLEAVGTIENDAALAVEAVGITAAAHDSDESPMELLTGRLVVSGWYKAQGSDEGAVGLPSGVEG